MRVLTALRNFLSDIRRIREALEEIRDSLRDIREILRPFGKQPDDPRYQRRETWKAK
jgi:hypothetical protein